VLHRWSPFWLNYKYLKKMLKDMHQNTTVDTHSCKQEISEAPPSAATISAPKSADALGAMSSPEAISKCAGEVAFFKRECTFDTRSRARLCAAL
jgi:hypothetical protein